MIVNRTESYLGGSYPLTDTLHFVDSWARIADYTLWRTAGSRRGRARPRG